MNDIDSGANLMLALGPPHIVRSSKTPVVAECRIPALGVPNVCKTGNSEKRKAAAAQIRTIVGSGQAQHIRSDVSPVIRSLCVLAHVCDADVPVHNKGRRECERMTDVHELHKRAEVSQSAVNSTVASPVFRLSRSHVPSQLPKKNSLSFLIGPPKVPPISFRILVPFFGCTAGVSKYCLALRTRSW